jgi:ABC-type phosphate/phosphonate transport system substrate-binding protein
MASGQMRVGSFSPCAYVDAQRGGKIQIIAQSILDHSATYRGLIIARKDSGLRTVGPSARSWPSNPTNGRC